ncbi:TIGR02186 family protein [Donghicola mangrovi]|uniref:TIGR02186 family protein n=1 Tax=Donghicola mangrovi TaxID=2729614 RepID=A0A850PYH4_9RHOB|nr:TIGR02186 family protein [Donghicola mangrovi]NVO21804.1 hypothetical protein [Donghicola mangrovi]
MLRLIAILCLALLSPLPLRAEEVVLGLSHEEIRITTRFDGSDILIYGAVKRDETSAPDLPLQVIITVAGPSGPTTVWRKERVGGIWMNTDSVEIDRAPSFYAVATTAPLKEILSETEDLRHKISIPRAIRSVGAPQNIDDAEAFTDALIRIHERNHSYLTAEGAAQLHENTLFDTNITLPSNLTEGEYKIRIFLTRDAAVVANYETPISVRKVGLERWLYALSREHALLYGLLSLALAVAAGWGASTFFALIKR